MRKILYLSMFMLLITLIACEKTLDESINLQEDSTEDWTVNAYIDNNLIFGPFTVSSQINIEEETISLKDNGEFWSFQSKVEFENSDYTFEIDSSVNEISNVNAGVKILNGNIVDKDSIIFDILFEDDETPYGFTYTIKGARK